MRKNKLFAISLATALAIGTAGCGNKEIPTNTSESEIEVVESSEAVETSETAESSETAGTTEKEEASEKVTEDGKMVITIGVPKNAFISDWDENLLTKAVEEQFNVECEFVFLHSTNPWGHLSQWAREMEADALPDMIICDNLTNSDIKEFVENNKITPIEDYVMDAEKTPYFNALPEDIKKACLGVMAYEDGHIYGFAEYEQSIERNNQEKLWINKDWLDKLDLEVPETTEELKEVLIAFREGDPNGNGIPDEIGIYGKRNGYGQDTIACLMNSFLETSWNNGKRNGGLAVNQETGEMIVAPFATEGWKEGLKYLNELYEEGVLAPAIFTDDEIMYREYISTNGNTIGLLDMVNDSKYSMPMLDEKFTKQFTYIAPLVGPEGYSWFPTLSSYSYVEVLFTCEGEKLEKCIAIQDAMYDFSTPESLGIIRLGRGEYGVDWTDDPEVLKTTSNIYVEAGVIDSLSYVQLKERPSEQNWNWNCYGAGVPENYIGWEKGANLYEGAYDITTAEDGWKVEYLQTVNDPKYLPKTLPVLNYSNEEKTEILKIQSGVLYCVNTFLEECITGVRDVETSWDAYLAELETLGLSKWLEIAQQAYDRQR